MAAPAHRFFCAICRGPAAPTDDARRPLELPLPAARVPRWLCPSCVCLVVYALDDGEAEEHPLVVKLLRRWRKVS